MTKKERFDTIIKNNLIDHEGRDMFGYEITTDRIYYNYYNEASFDKFVNDMKKPPYKYIFDNYNKGKGSELIPHSGRYGEMPPKMASVASSSRFCYLALRDGADALGGSGKVKFEKGCKISGITGNAPQLDAYIKNENIYVEAKCHEIFDSHHIIMREAYRELITNADTGFGIKNITENSKGEIVIPLSEFGINKPSSMFDIKQFLCHLVGIASQNGKGKPSTLVYMFFKPVAESKEDALFIEDTFKLLKDEIYAIFTSDPISAFIKKNDIDLKAVAEYDKVMSALTDKNIKPLY